MGLGYFGYGMGALTSFWVSLSTALIVGMGSAFGEVTHYGYIDRYPSEFVGPFAMGTGFSGLVGSLLYVILHGQKIEDYIIFFCLVPIAFIYLCNFVTLNSVG